MTEGTPTDKDAEDPEGLDPRAAEGADPLAPASDAEDPEGFEPTLPGLEPPTVPHEPEGAVPFPVPDGVVDYSPEELGAALAAVCFAVNRPVTLAETAAILGRSQADVAQAADHLAATLRGGALMVQRHQDEIQLVTRPEVAWAVQRALNPEKPGRLSRAALETLAIVAYRQPLTRASVEAIRGVNCEAVLDSLERRGLIAEVGRQDTPGHPRLFGTTLRFLQVVGLERIGNLPPLPEGLKVPELPAAAWDLEGAAEPAAAEPGAIEVRGEPVPSAATDPDEGYGDLPDDDEHGDGTLADDYPGGEQPGPADPGSDAPGHPAGQ